MTNLKRLGLITFVVFAGWFAADYGVAQQKPPVDPALANSKQFQRWWWAFQQRAYPLGYIPADAKQRALQQIEGSKAARPSQPAQGVNWVNIGPAPIEGGEDLDGDLNQTSSGRVADIAVDPSSPNHWLIGAAQGGIWETFDAGANWAPKTDAQASLAMGAIAFAPSNPTIIYAGTGEGEFAGQGYAGAGLLKSTDGGNTWTLLATDTFAKTSFSDIKVDPTDPNIVIVATVFGIAGRDHRLPPDVPLRGIFKSTDGGVSWSQKLAPDATDLDVDPTNFNNQYAGIGFPRGFALNGVYRSSDAGETWTLIGGPWEILPGSVGRVELAIAPSNPNIAYVSIQDAESDGLLGLFRTDNAWDASPLWTQITSAPDFCGPYCEYSHEIIVDPSDPDLLYAGGISLWKCTTCSAVAATWTDIGKTDSLDGIHPDQHSMVWVGSRLLVGNDGGVWSTTDGGNTWTNHNDNLSITQFYAGSIDPSGHAFLGGSQDNGTERWSAFDLWHWINGDDGATNAISSSHPDTDWAVSNDKLQIRRTTDGGDHFTVADSGIDHTGAPFIARFEKCPANDDVFIAGTDNLWKSTNFFSGGSPSWLSNGPEMGASITAMAFAPSDTTCNTYAFGTADGRIRVTSNGGTKWIDIDRTITEFPAPFRRLGDITAGPDGALWFIGVEPNGIGRITPDGTVTQFPILDGRFPVSITAGSDSALWFTMGIQNSSGSIGRITTDGVFSEFSLGPLTSPHGITAGPDGALWFTATTVDPGPPVTQIDGIWRITTDGTVVEFHLPPRDERRLLWGITAGPDGNLWFTDYINDFTFRRMIGRSTTGGAITEFPGPPTIVTPSIFITAGPDGGLWYTDSDASDIVRVTTGGAFTVHVFSPARHPNGITKGPDGALWFAEGVGKIGRITTEGTITDEFPVPTPDFPFAITVGPDDALWFTEFTGNKIGRIGDFQLPHRYVTGLAFDPRTDPGNPNTFTLYVTLSGFDQGTPSRPGHVFKGKLKITPSGDLDTIPTWSDVTPKDADGNRVNIPCNTIVLNPFDPNIVYVGTDIGVWTSNNGGMTWTHMGPETGMPNVAVYDLQFSDTGVLVAFTHGRGAFVLGQ